MTRLVDEPGWYWVRTARGDEVRHIEPMVDCEEDAEVEAVLGCVGPPTGCPTHFTLDPGQPQPSAWVPETDPVVIATLGKAIEEMNECSKELARGLIQGLAERDPGTGRLNAMALLDELADVEASSILARAHVMSVLDRCGVDTNDVDGAGAHYRVRVERKLAHKRGWHGRLRLLRKER